MTKSDLRKLYKAKREVLSEIECQKLTLKMYSQFLKTTDLNKLNVIHIFLPITKFKEVNTLLWISALKKEFPHIKLCIPSVDFKTDRVLSYFLDDDLKTEKSSWGTTEPTNGNLCNPQLIDLVITPLLAFDKRGYRVGYGKGIYDSFFNDCRPNCIRLGVSYFEPVYEITDVYEGDMKLNRCVMPNNVYEFGTP